MFGGANGTKKVLVQHTRFENEIGHGRDSWQLKSFVLLT